MTTPRDVIVKKVNFLWYLAPIVPILALGYAALVDWLPSWLLLLVVFAFFMWLFSLVFAAFAVLMRWLAKRKENRQ